MKIFVTGGTGTIGSAVVATLVRAGHQVTGLVRSAEKAAAIEKLGARPILGSISEPSTYRAAAASSDASIHMAADYVAGMPPGDRTAIETLMDAARSAGAPRSILYTSGVLVLGVTGDRVADETASTAGALAMVAWRPAHEQMVLDAGTETIATSVVRPGFVYGGLNDLPAGYFASALREGAAVHVGDGSNRMALIHLSDLAEFYRLAVEKRARGIFHAVDGASPRIQDMARAASEAAGKGGATRTWPVDDARKTIGPFADALLADQRVVNTRGSELGWKPLHPPFLESAAAVFAEWQTAVEAK